MKLNENNLLGAVNELRAKGYEDDYIVDENNLICTNSNKCLTVNDFEVEDAFQFEITENAIDSQFLFTIKDKQTQNKGLLIDLMGSHYYDDTLISEKLKVPTDMYVCEDNSPMKYGMPKIFKDIFNQNPERFELRIGHLDMPACPFGNSFKALGYDRISKEYVWLVTSIIKDKRLERVTFEG